MQIFVKVKGQTLTLEVEPGFTITQLKALVADRLSAGTGQQVPPGDVQLVASGKALDEGPEAARLTVGDYNLQRHQTLMGAVKEPLPVQGDGYVPHIKAALARDLTNLSRQNNVFVFVGLASYDNGHPEIQGDTVSRQQCPDHLPGLCQAYNLALHILLVDLAYGERLGEAQIYDRPGWSLVSEGDRGDPNDLGRALQVRSYRHENGAQLTCYPTHIAGPEYNVANFDVEEAAKAPPQRTLAGLDLHQIAAGIEGNGGVLVAGNFFTKAAPYLVAGKSGILPKLGAPYYLGD